MGIKDKRLSDLAQLSSTASHTMYFRHPYWYVQFSVAGRQLRMSTRCTTKEGADELIASYRFNSPIVAEWMDSHAHRALTRAKARARVKRLECTITLPDIRAIFARAGGRCEITRHPFAVSGPFRPSLDRIDPARGYVPDNLRATCLVANTAMLHYGEGVLLELARSIVSVYGMGDEAKAA